MLEIVLPRFELFVHSSVVGELSKFFCLGSQEFHFRANITRTMKAFIPNSRLRGEKLLCNNPVYFSYALFM